MGDTLYVSANATQLVERSAPKPKRHALLWGDAVSDVEPADAKHVLGTSHGHTGLVARGDLQADPPKLLEIYVIDVGQGDAILFRTPDGCWHLIDGGPAKGRSAFGEGARAFLAWKFGADLRLGRVPLTTVILSHSDADHFAGLTEILESDFPPRPGTKENSLRTTVEHFLHAGVAKYTGPENLGRVGDEIPKDRLLDGLDSFADPNVFAPEFGGFATALGKVTNAAGAPPTCQRVTLGAAVPGYEDGTGAVVMHVLGPVPETDGGLKFFTDASHTVNGHSVVVRVDYGAVRVLLAGDTNTEAQRHLLGRVAATEFRADVMKASHHGAEEIDAEFTKAIRPRVTVVSSGDNENYSHPRPAALGGYPYYGRRSFVTDREDQIQPPLVYGTEIARSINAAARAAKGDDVKKLNVVFGLVNVRTDGHKIVCAVRDERNAAFDVEELYVRVPDQPPDDRPAPIVP
jgi:beta-lactamase superfamily II metal-dependent hydrolase